MFVPRKRRPQYDSLLRAIAAGLAWRLPRHEFRQLQHWRIYAVDQRNGRCYPSRAVITIPVWAIRRNLERPGYLVWYVAHELAHCFTRDNHGPDFMAALRMICPEDYQHHEHGYKPRNAKAAGVPGAEQHQRRNVGYRTKHVHWPRTSGRITDSKCKGYCITRDNGGAWWCLYSVDEHGKWQRLGYCRTKRGCKRGADNHYLTGDVNKEA